MRSTSMRILTHNVYWFQGSPSRWGKERVAASDVVFDALAELYASQRPDVVCLQEVQAERFVRSLSERLNLPDWIFFPGGKREDYGGAILCRAGAELADRTRDAGEALHERFHARANTGGMVIASIHLPSNRYHASRAEGEAARVAELDQIVSTAPAPDVVLGDFNSTPGSAPYRHMRERGYIDAAAETGADTLSSFRTHRVDYTWLGPQVTERLSHFETLEYGPFVRTEANGNTWRLSDHPPLILELA